jgi:hypothetical protein
MGLDYLIDKDKMRYHKSGESTIPLKRIIPNFVSDGEAVIEWYVSVLSDRGDETTPPSITVRMNDCVCVKSEDMSTDEINGAMCPVMVAEFLMESGELWN